MRLLFISHLLLGFRLGTACLLLCWLSFGKELKAGALEPPASTLSFTAAPAQHCRPGYASAVTPHPWPVEAFPLTVAIRIEGGDFAANKRGGTLQTIERLVQESFSPWEAIFKKGWSVEPTASLLQVTEKPNASVQVVLVPQWPPAILKQASGWPQPVSVNNAQNTKTQTLAAWTVAKTQTTNEAPQLQQATIYLRLLQPNGSPFSPVQLKQVLLHEWGHALGLFGHSPNPNDMLYAKRRFSPASSRVGKPQPTQLSPADQATLRAVYGFACQ
jgi:hypothetical protein